MKKNTMLIVGIIIVVMLVLAAFLTIGNDGTWDTPWSDGTINGMWEQEIILEYEDGTLQSLKPIYENSILKVINDGKTIAGIHYMIYGTASGTGYSNAVINFKSYKVIYQVKSGSTIKRETIQDFGALNVPDMNLPVDGVKHLLVKVYHVKTALGDGLAVGSYTVSIVPSGSITYSADGGSPETASLPSTISFVVTIQSDNTLSISFSSGYTLH